MNDHVPQCMMKAFGHSDAAKRIADAYNLHRLADPLGSIGKWIAAALIDGHTDNVLYASRRDAAVHQHNNEQYFTFIMLNPSTLAVCDAEILLRTGRRLYDAGLKMTDPDDARVVVQRMTREDADAFSRGRVQNLIFGEEDR